MEERWRVLNALQAIWSELPALAKDQWAGLRPQLQDLMARLAEAQDEEEAARLGVEVQNLLQDKAPAALKRYLEVLKQMREEVTRGFLPPWLPPGLIPADTEMVCPIDPEGCPRQVLRMAGQRLRCPKHNVDLIPSPRGQGKEHGD